MAKESFIPKAFNAKHQALISTADQIMRSYAAQGYDLSLRQLYYQFVAHHGLPNTEQNYKLLGGVISDARLAGLLDWDSLVDRGRSTIRNSHWDTPADIIDSSASSFRIDLWDNQRYHVEVMVEKQALEGVLVPVCRRLDVPFTANKGYSSSSAMYEAGKRLAEKISHGKDIVVIYLGDHDPSGIDMGRDVLDRLALFSGAGYWDSDERAVQTRDDGAFTVERIALNMDQIRTYNPPPNPAKMTDSRAGGYVSKFGYESWELDALDPDTLAELVETAVANYIDSDRWGERVALMENGRQELLEMAKSYRENEER